MEYITLQVTEIVVAIILTTLFIILMKWLNNIKVKDTTKAKCELKDCISNNCTNCKHKIESYAYYKDGMYYNNYKI